MSLSALKEIVLEEVSTRRGGNNAMKRWRQAIVSAHFGCAPDACRMRVRYRECRVACRGVSVTENHEAHGARIRVLWGRRRRRRRRRKELMYIIIKVLVPWPFEQTCIIYNCDDLLPEKVPELAKSDFFSLFIFEGVKTKTFDDPDDVRISQI